MSIPNVHTIFNKITPEEIAEYLDAEYSQRSDFLADVISFSRERGDANTTPREPSTVGTVLPVVVKYVLRKVI